MNPVLQYGFEKFCQHAAELPVDGLILPDLPEHEFETIYGRNHQTGTVWILFFSLRLKHLKSASGGWML